MPKKVTIDGYVIEVTTADRLTDDVIAGRYRLKLLAYGMSGGGKTYLITTMPKGVGVVDTDRGALTMAHCNRSDIKIVQVGELGSGKEAKDAWNRVQIATDMFIKDDEVETIAVDSLTTVSSILMKYILFLNGHSGKQPTWPEYGAQMDMLMEYITKLFNANKHFILTAHEYWNKDEITGKAWCNPLVTGQLREKLPNYFDEVYVMQPSTNSKGEVTYNMMTRADRMYRAKSRLAAIGVTSNPEVPDLKLLFNRIEAFRKARATE